MCSCLVKISQQIMAIIFYFSEELVFSLLHHECKVVICLFGRDLIQRFYAYVIT